VEIKEKAWNEIRARENSVRDLALEILFHPEIGYQETRAARALTGFLASEGFEIQQPFGGLATAFRAVKGKDSYPSIFFIAEYDALPGVGHGCGHNLIGPAAAAAAVGAAAVLEKTGGTVGVIGTPAEEYLGIEEGKVKLLQAGAFQGITAVLMMHPSTQNQVLGSDLGFIACEIRFQGRTAHAAADPWNGRNALDGLLAVFSSINALRQHVPPDVRMHGIITEGGEAPNIIPERAFGQFMVRAATPTVLHEVYDRVCLCAEAAALSSGTEVEINRITTVYNSRINDPLNRLIKDNFLELGISLPKDPLEMSASSDFGNVSQQVPAAMFTVESHPEGIPWHSAAVAEASGEEKALQAMITAACVMAGAAVDLLSDHGLSAEVENDYQQKNQ